MIRLLQLRLVIYFYTRYRRIWVEYGKFATVITLFPLDQTQRYSFIFIKRKVQNFDELVNEIENIEVLIK